jgi:hypothetical protein
MKQRAPGAAQPPTPVVGVTAFLRQPVHAAALYSSQFLIVNGYYKRRPLELQLAKHTHNPGDK